MDGFTAAHRLTCPIPPRISPHADAVQRWLTGWVHRCGLPPTSRGAQQVALGGFGRYAARLYPEATEDDLRVLAALFAWFFLLDEECDATGTPEPARLRALLDAALSLLRTGRAPRDALRGPLRRMLREAWRTPSRRMPASWRERFTDAVAHHFDGVLAEAANKAVGRRPGLAEYVELRRATSAAYVSYTWIEFATGVPVPDAVYHHPAVRAVSEAGNDLLSWFNDLLSLERDTATSGGHNLVLAVAAERGLPAGAAVADVVRRWQERMRRFAQLRTAVPPFGPPLDAALRHYLDGVANSVRGTIDWSLETTARYRAPAAADGGR
ncbi:terpene synthase family protein [Micromonospora pattaloongensis]|uniref:terpene synthase family protein n=1 Tax=Micromonospora pattaloongensis TaxID=405436 RepID=UPI000B871478|nr:terpene synthase [Micromonospora pattaloongensis]